MKDPIASYWNLKLSALKTSLEANNFETFIVQSAVSAKELVLSTIIPSLSPRSVSWR